MTMTVPDPDRAPLPSRLRVRQDGPVPVVVVPSGMPFERLREWIRSRLPEVLPDLGGSSCRLDLGDRDIELFDVRRLLHLLRDDFQIEVTGLYVRPAAIHRYAERELKLRLFPVRPEDAVSDDDVDPAASAEAERIPGLAETLAALDAPATREDEAATDDDDPADASPDLLSSDDLLSPDDATDSEAIPDTFEPAAATRRPIPLPELPKEEEAEVDEHGGKRVLTVRRTLRSGASVRYDGDVHVFGDVNAGAQIRAGGNVVVFGRLRGMVHAGAQGDDAAFILAFDLSPTQLRIARQIAIAPERTPADHFAPEIAQVEDETIVIEPYRGRIGLR